MLTFHLEHLMGMNQAVIITIDVSPYVYWWGHCPFTILLRFIMVILNMLNSDLAAICTEKILMIKV